MAERIRAFDWSKTPLGSMDRWPQSLRTAVSICLGSRFPMMLWWGPDLINIYNDAYVPVLGQWHPNALGKSGRDVWKELWPVIAPQVEEVMERGGSTFNDRVHLVYTRHGYPEDTWYTWSYGPIRDESGRVGGLFNTCHDETQRVLAERERDRLAAHRQLALNAARLGWWHYDPVTKVATFDQRYTEIFGVTGNERPNEEILKRLHPDDLPGVWAKVEAALNPIDPKPYAAEYRIVLDDRSVRWVEAHGTATFDGEGAARCAVSFVGTVADVTERRVANAATRDAEQRYRAVFESSRDGKLIYTLDGTIVDANPAACEMYGYTHDEIVGVHAPSAMHPDALPAFREFQRVAGSGTEFRCETVDRRRDGSVFPIEVVGTPLMLNGQPHLMSVIRDITERVRADERLRRSHDTFYHLIQNNPFGVYVVDADFRLREVSLGAQKVFQHVPRPLLGRDFAEVLRSIWAEPFATEAVAKFRHTLDTGEPYAAVRTVERRQDITEVEAYDWRIERIVLPDGRFGVVCYFYDLSERQKWEAELAEARRRLDSALIAGEVATFEWDVVSDRLWGDRNFARIFGIEPDDHGSSPLAAYVAAIHADDRDAVVERVRRAVETGCDYEAEYRIATSVPPRWVIARGRVERDDAGRALRFPGVILDVTEQKRAEAALRESEGRFRQLADAMPQMVWVTRPDGYHEYYNKRWYEFTGVPEGSTDGEGWNRMFHPDDQDRAWTAWRHSLTTGKPYEIEYRLRHRSGEYRWTLGRALPIHDGTGAITKWFGTCTDIDALKRLQRERETLLERERAARTEAERASEAKSEFLATLSHELRTPLTPVLLTVSLMESHPDLHPQLREDVTTIRRNVELESQLISDLLDLTRITRGKLQLEEQDTDLHLIVRRAIDICQREASAKLTVDLRATRYTVRGDSTRLQQVFWNLINNAIKFTPEDGTITVRSYDAPEGCIGVDVSDTGAGIDAAVLPKIFDAFEQGEVRSARQQAGLGLGLAISKKLAEAHGGTVQAKSEGRGRGATFTVELPLTNAPVRVGAPYSPMPVSTASRPLNVLLVEDHEPTLRAMERLLRQIGHRVTGVTSVASATAAARQDGFDLIISDLGLPDGSGLDVMRELRDRYTGRSIALTGYGMESDIAASRSAGFAEHLTKPVDLAALDAAIRRVSASAEGAADAR